MVGSNDRLSPELMESRWRLENFVISLFEHSSVFTSIEMFKDLVTIADRGESIAYTNATLYASAKRVQVMGAWQISL